MRVNGSLVGFLECSAGRTNTSVTLDCKLRFLPIAIPVQCLVDPPWLPVSAHDGVYSDASSAPGSEDEDDLDQRPGPKAWVDSKVYVRHKTFRCVRSVADESGANLSCGRTMSTRPGMRCWLKVASCSACFRDL